MVRTAADGNDQANSDSCGKSLPSTAAGLTPSSRLGCQACVGEADAAVRIPGNRIAS